jgi:predicted O-methyltransferase YrrM
VNARRRTLADELYAASREHDARQTDRLARWRNVEPETASLLAVLVRAMGARRILEIGTSNGYSTLWLGDAAQAVGGSVLSLEVLPERTALAAGYVERADLEGVVELRTQDAAEALARFEDSAWDFVFLDAERSAYAGYWPDLARVLASPGLLAVDNVISHAAEVVDFRALVDADTEFVSSVVPIGAGLLLVAPTHVRGTSW